MQVVWSYALPIESVYKTGKIKYYKARVVWHNLYEQDHMPKHYTLRDSILWIVVMF